MADDDYERLQHNVGTPFQNSQHRRLDSSEATFSSPSQLETVANRQISELNERVEKLASKILTAEKEKSSLRKELDSQKKSNAVVERLKLELMATEESLENALLAAKQSNEEVQYLSEELEELKRLLRDTKEELRLNSSQCDRTANERDVLRREVADLRTLLEHQQTKQQLQKDSHIARDEYRDKNARHRLTDQQDDLDDLKSINMRLQAELDRHLTESTTLNHRLLQSCEELEHCKRQLLQVESQLRDSRSENLRHERDLAAQSAEKTALQRQCVSLQSTIKTLEADLASVIRAKHNTPSKPSSRTAQRRAHLQLSSASKQSTSPVKRSMFGTSGYNYMDALSTDESEAQEELGLKGHGVRYLDRVTTASATKTRQYRQQQNSGKSPVAQFGVSELERSAAEIMAHIMLEELQQQKQTSKGSTTANSSMNQDGVREACIRAALRLVYTSSHLAAHTTGSDHDEGGDSPRNSQSSRPPKVAPFHQLGDRDVLSRLVAETHAGLTALEEAEMMREEVTELEKLIRELEIAAETAERSIAEKDSVLKTLQRHAEEAKRQAEDTVHELENLHLKLQNGRDELLRMDADRQLLKREGDLARTSLKDAAALSDLENRNLQTLRNRVQELKQEQMTLDAAVMTAKDQVLKEESKLRTTKATSAEQLRLLQVDLSKLSQDFRAKQRALEDLEAHRRAVEEEHASRCRESDGHLVQVTRSLDEESRKLTALKQEARYLKLEVDQLQSKRKQVDQDLSSLQERLTAEQSAAASDELELRRKIEQHTRLLQEQERKHQQAKEATQGLIQEQGVLKHSVEELRRQQQELERANEAKRRSLENEAQQAQHAAQLAVRTMRQATAQVEAKQAELEALQAEVRTQERRVEDAKRQVREHESRYEQQRDLTTTLHSDRDKLHKELAQTQRDIDDLRHQSLVVRTSLEHENRAVDEVRRRLSTLQAEEQQLQESDAKLRQSLQTLKAQVDTAQQELTSLHTNSERTRRSCADLHAQKALLESEIQRQQDTLRNAKQRAQEESQRTGDVEQSVRTALEELHRAQKLLKHVESQVDSAQRAQEDLAQKDRLARQQLQTLTAEVDNLAAQAVIEKRSLEALRNEVRDAQRQQQVQKDEDHILQQQWRNIQAEVEALRLQREHYVALKQSLEQEAVRVRDTTKSELKRMEQLEHQCTTCEKRLRALQDELAVVEANYAQAKHATAAETRRANAQRDVLHQTQEEVQRLANQRLEVQSAVEDSKRRALQEIARLEQAKHDTQHDILRLAETQKRLQQQQQQHSPTHQIQQQNRARSVSPHPLGNSTKVVLVSPPSLSMASTAQQNSTLLRPSLLSSSIMNPVVANSSSPSVAALGGAGSRITTAAATSAGINEDEIREAEEARSRRGRWTSSVTAGGSDRYADSRSRSNSRNRSIKQTTFAVPLDEFGARGNDELDDDIADDDSLAAEDERKESSYGGSASSEFASSLSSLQRAVQSLRMQSGAVLETQGGANGLL